MTMRSILTIGLCLALASSAGVAAGPAAAAAAPPTTVSGQIFDDANSSGRFEPGEAARGFRFTLSDLRTDKAYVVTTGARGRFRLTVPTASYYVSGYSKGWALIPEVVTAGAGKTLALRAVRPLGKVLKPAVHFTERRYARGATAHIVFSLANTGPQLLRGIGPECAHAGDPDELVNLGKQWGALAADGPGVTLPAHRTRTFTVSVTVPAAAERAGQVVIACDFGYPAVDQGQRPEAFDTAKVPGMSGAISGNVYYPLSGHPGKTAGLAKVRVVLADPSTCPVFSRAVTTDAAGNFRFAKVPAGQSYEMYLFTPSGWKVRYGNAFRTMVDGQDTVRLGIEVERGSARKPTVPTCR